MYFQISTYAGIETTFQPMHQTDNYFSPLQQSYIGIQQEEASLPNSPFYSPHFGNESNIMQIPSETIEQEEFVNSIFC